MRKIRAWWPDDRRKPAENMLTALPRVELAGISLLLDRDDDFASRVPFF